MTNLRPMKPCTYNKWRAWLDQSGHDPFPVLVQPKLDGIRGIIHNGLVYSSSGIILPNRGLPAWVHQLESITQRSWEGSDGEFFVENRATAYYNSGNNSKYPQSYQPFDSARRAVMAYDAPLQQPLLYVVYDNINRGDNYQSWWLKQNLDPLDATTPEYQNHIREVLFDLSLSPRKISQLTATCQEELQRLMIHFNRLGYEGAIIRSPYGPYKHGKSTPREGYLIKYKQWVHSAATIVGFTPLYRNLNDPEQNLFGLQTRSTHQHGREETDLLGSFSVKAELGGQEVFFSVGSGLTEAQRADFWSRRKSLLNTRLEFKYMPFGTIEAPRHPIFINLLQRRKK